MKRTLLLFALSLLLTVGAFGQATRRVDYIQTTSVDVGAAAGTGVTALERGNGVIHQSVLTLSSLAITMTDGGVNGSIGSQKIYDFPEGNVIILGVVSNFSSITAASGIGATAAVKHSVGQAAEATNDTLDATQADMLPSTSITLAASAGSGGGVSTATLIKDGSATAADAYLNIGVADAGSTANSSVTITGTITIVWIKIGDK